jgi:uncharacterized SAM-binding protein YcdF (DUF218 family)
MRQDMQKLGWKLGLLAIFAGIYPTLEEVACRQVFSFFHAGGAPHGADIIVVLGGGGGRRIHQGLKLLKQGFAPRILFIGTESEMRFAFQTSRKVKDWASGRICFGDRPVRNTCDSVRHLYEWALSHQVRQCLVVSDANHLGRVSAQLANFSDDRLETHLVASGTPPRLDDAGQRWGVFREAAAYVLVKMGRALHPETNLGLPSSAFLL